MSQNRKIVASFLVAATLLKFADAHASKKTPSFNCRKATTQVEKAICESHWLMDLDVAMASSFKRAKSVFAGNPTLLEELKTSQIEWAKNRGFCFIFGALGEGENCLAETYRNRQSLLEGVVSKKTIDT